VRVAKFIRKQLLQKPRTKP